MVKILGKEYPLKARVTKIGGFSAHADRSELLDWVGAFQKKPRHTFVVHGDEEVSLAFAETLRREAGLPEVAVPHLGEGFDLG